MRPHLQTAVDEDELVLLADAQTSGGLLVAGDPPPFNFFFFSVSAAQSPRYRDPWTFAAPRGRPRRPQVCPYCAVGCGQRVYVKDEKVTQIEGDPDTPISRGRLCPKGSASKNLVTSPLRQTKVHYRRPYGTEWEDLDLDTAMEMIADRVLEARAATWQDIDEQGRKLHRHARHRQPRRRDARQRGELPHQEAVHGDGRDPDREPGAI